MLKSNNFFQGLVKYSIIFICFLCLNSVHPLIFGSTALYVSLLYFCPPLLLSVIYVLSFLTFKSLNMIFCAMVEATVLGGAFLIYSLKNKTPKGEIIFFYLSSVLPYVFWGGEINTTLIISGIVGVFAVVCTLSQGYLWSVLHKISPSPLQTISAYLTLIFLGVGFVNLFGVLAYKAICVLALLFSIKCFEKTPYILFGLLAIPIYLVTKIQSYFIIIFLWLIFSVIVSKNHSAFSALFLILAEAVCLFILKLYPSYSTASGLTVVIPAIFFCFLPQKLFDEIKNKFKVSSSQLLTFNYINRSRMDISSKLYEMSGVFFKMEKNLSIISQNGLSTDQLIEQIGSQAISNVCGECEYFSRCKQRGFPERELMEKFVRVGIAKSRVSFIDLPREFTELCSYPNSIIFEVNRAISGFLEQIKEIENKNNQRELLQTQANALSQIMKNLAFKMSKTLRPNGEREKQISALLKQRGMPLLGVLVLGEEGQSEINVFCKLSVAQNPNFLPTLNSICKENLTPVKTEKFNDSSVYITLKKTPSLDATFGVAVKTKTGSNLSGDNHSLTKIDQGKFLLSISDGMGSGDQANQLSTASIELIESYYKAGLDRATILNVVNKILTVDKADSFSAVDIATVDLYSSTCDFIKIGSPYGFILSSGGVKFIEGSSLPLGILQEINPSVTKAEIHPDDVIVLLSDGVTDAFGSSSEAVEFLRNAPIKNPQALAETIVEKALTYSSGIAHDDMTALCVRIIEKTT